MSTEGKTIGEVVQDYNEAKESLQLAIKNVVEKAKSLDLDPKVAEDVRIALAYLSGYRKGPRNARG